MGEENEEVDTKVNEEQNEEIKKAEAEVDNSAHLTKADLQSLRDDVSSIRSDRAADAQEKAELKARQEKLDERLEHLIKAQEEKDKKQSDSSTLIVPPAELDTPTHLNKEEVKQENQNEPIKQTRGWKRGW
jgi:hypothetical protein